MKYYVMSDVHGYYKCFIRALKKAGFFEEKEPYKLVLCGDLLDRGEDAKALIAFVLSLKREGKLIYVLGNHEDLLVQCLQEIARGGIYDIASGLSHHLWNGTWDTLLQIAEMSEKEACDDPEELVRRVMRSSFYKELLPIGVDYYESERYVFTHGWIPCITEGYKPFTDCKYMPDWRDAEIEHWRRARWFNGMEIACRYGVRVPDKTVVCGHWHCSFGHAQIEGRGSERGEDADFSPFYAEGIIAIDAATALSESVNCIVLEDKELSPS